MNEKSRKSIKQNLEVVQVYAHKMTIPGKLSYVELKILLEMGLKVLLWHAFKNLEWIHHVLKFYASTIVRKIE